VAEKIRKRKGEDKESEVYIDGKLVDSKKVKKETSRYGSSSATAELSVQGNLTSPISHLELSLKG
jgi:hypothetical protein